MHIRSVIEHLHIQRGSSATIGCLIPLEGWVVDRQSVFIGINFALDNDPKSVWVIASRYEGPACRHLMHVAVEETPDGTDILAIKQGDSYVNCFRSYEEAQRALRRGGSFACRE